MKKPDAGDPEPSPVLDVLDYRPPRADRKVERPRTVVTELIRVGWITFLCIVLWFVVGMIVWVLSFYWPS